MADIKIIASAVAENNGGFYETTVRVQHHTFLADEPTQYGGKDLGPSPVDYMCGALASCTAITLRMYVQRKNWRVEEIKVKVTLLKGDQMASARNSFQCEVDVTGDLNEEQRKRLVQIAKACPVHKLLNKPSDVLTLMPTLQSDDLPG